MHAQPHAFLHGSYVIESVERSESVAVAVADSEVNHCISFSLEFAPVYVPNSYGLPVDWH